MIGKGGATGGATGAGRGTRNLSAPGARGRRRDLRLASAPSTPLHAPPPAPAPAHPIRPLPPPSHALCRCAPPSRPSSCRLRREERARQEVTTAGGLAAACRVDPEREAPPRPLSCCAASRRQPPAARPMPAAAGRTVSTDSCTGRAAPLRGEDVARRAGAAGRGLYGGVGAGLPGVPAAAAAPPPAPHGGRRVAH